MECSIVRPSPASKARPQRDGLGVERKESGPAKGRKLRETQTDRQTVRQTERERERERERTRKL